MSLGLYVALGLGVYGATRANEANAHPPPPDLNHLYKDPQARAQIYVQEDELMEDIARGMAERESALRNHYRARTEQTLARHLAANNAGTFPLTK